MLDENQIHQNFSKVVAFDSVVEIEALVFTDEEF